MLKQLKKIMKKVKYKIKRHFPKYEYDCMPTPNDYIVYQEMANDDWIVEIIEQQIYVNANQISIENCNNGNPIPEFPWHGYSEQQFEELNSMLVSSLESAKKCHTEKQTTRFIRRNRLVYELFFQQPIRVIMKDNGTYEIFYDGRHRVYSAQKGNNEIPVFVLKEIPINQLSVGEYAELCRLGPWNFLVDSDSN